MYFTESNKVPVNLSPEKKIEKKYDRVMVTMQVSLTKNEMKENFETK
jgi:hypothetical protein